MNRLETIVHIVKLDNGNSFSLCGETSKFGFKEPELLSGHVLCEDCYSQTDESQEFHMIRQFLINNGLLT